ncbi:hypothetical protein Fcan01_22907 [Folsomia candida]|uniref:Uncharacterized protein n=1 Tax=Folsomia candida TaxID=158441 RepID=A0A226DCF3_FOLCA|nr:hypothetical protein Fcan01_22907 [Folsomia candida]
MRDPTQYYSVELSQPLCEILGYSLCIFEKSGQYPAKEPINEVMLKEYNDTVSLTIIKWTPEAVNIFPHTTNGSTGKGVITILHSVDRCQVAIINSNHTARFTPSQDFERMFNVPHFISDSPLLVYKKNTYTKRVCSSVFPVESNCSMSLAITYNYKAMSVGFNSVNISVEMLVDDINSTYFGNEISLTIGMKDNRTTIIMSDPFDTYSLHLSHELSKVLGFSNPNLTMTGVFTSDGFIYNIPLQGSEMADLKITVMRTTHHNIQINPRGNTLESVIASINEAVWTFGNHLLRVIQSPDSSFLEVNLAEYMTLQFSTCLNAYVGLESSFQFSQSTTTVSIVPLIAAIEPGSSDISLPSNSAICSGDSLTPSETHPAVTEESYEENDVSTENSLVRSNTSSGKKGCKVLLKEILPGAVGDLSNIQFIELKMVCNGVSVPKRTSLDGYVILILEMRPILQIVFSAHLAKEKFVKVTRTSADGLRPMEGWFFVLGTKNVLSVTSVITWSQYVTDAFRTDSIIPSDKGYPIAIVLLRFTISDICAG